MACPEIFVLSSSYSRGLRLLNARKQVLLQDDIQTSQPLLWRAHTNATIAVNSQGNGATLTIGDKSLQMTVLSPTSGVTIPSEQAVRFPNDPPLPSGGADSPNPGVSVITISLPAGQYSLQILFNPQWPGMSASDFVTPPSVPLSGWTIDSHN